MSPVSVRIHSIRVTTVQRHQLGTDLLGEQFLIRLWDAFRWQVFGEEWGQFSFFHYENGKHLGVSENVVYP